MCLVARCKYGHLRVSGIHAGLCACVHLTGNASMWSRLLLRLAPQSAAFDHYVLVAGAGGAGGGGGGGGGVSA